MVVGLTGTCPYGIAACWGGANEGLHALELVEFVDPIPDGQASTATVFLVDDGLPPLERWREQFRRVVNESYVMRGFEVTLEGTIDIRDGDLVLGAGRARLPVLLAPLDAANKVQWNRTTRLPQPAQPEEVAAYATLATRVRADPAQPLTVTGPLLHTDAGYQLEVRLVQPLRRGHS